MAVARADLKAEPPVKTGRRVEVAVPGGTVTGEAVDVDEGGRLVVRTAAGEEHLGAGDVVHVRP